MELTEREKQFLEYIKEAIIKTIDKTIEERKKLLREEKPGDLPWT